MALSDAFLNALGLPPWPAPGAGQRIRTGLTMRGLGAPRLGYDPLSREDELLLALPGLIACVSAAHARFYPDGGADLRDLLTGETWIAPSGVTLGSFASGSPALLFDGGSATARNSIFSPMSDPPRGVPTQNYTFGFTVEVPSPTTVQALIGATVDGELNTKRFSIGFNNRDLRGYFAASAAGAGSGYSVANALPESGPAAFIVIQTPTGVTVRRNGVVIGTNTTEYAARATVLEPDGGQFLIGWASQMSSNLRFSGKLGDLICLGEDYSAPANARALRALEAVLMDRIGLAPI